MAAAKQRRAFLDRPLVPASAVLIGERNQGPARVDPGPVPRMGEQHEGQQAADLIVGQETIEHAGEADRLSARSARWISGPELAA
jgi:hypothetical protein